MHHHRRGLRAAFCLVWLFLSLPAVAAGLPDNESGAQAPPARGGSRSRPKAGSHVQVRHDGQPLGAWYLSETRNFRIFHNQPWELAERVARAAEQARAEAYAKWFGKAAPDWGPRCDIYVHANGQDYTWETGLPAQASGFARTRHEEGRIVLRRVDVHCDEPEMCTAVLLHEVTHIVLASEYGADRVPHWASEGVAVLAEPTAKVALHLRDLPRYYRAGQLYKVRTLVELTGYPEPAHLGIFYAQSVSLVRFLGGFKGPEVLPRFLRDAARGGWTEALRRHYGVTFDELERLWLRHTFTEKSLSAAR
jgi:hypothetical protein